MPAAIDAARVRECLKQFRLEPLFIEELGWDHHIAQTEVSVDGVTCCLRALAQKRGMVAFEGCPETDASIPNYATRRKIEREVARIAHEHLIVYTDAARTVQVWQWVKREPGRPTACREHTYHKGQPGDALVQKLQWLAVGLDEEEGLTVVDVAGRARRAFDVDRVTRRFYDVFKTEHAAFLEVIRGIPGDDDRKWYASLMLNRLMFIYFIQRKGFLDGDPDYLRNRLHMMQERRKRDEFLTFYRHFLLRLFHEGLGQEQRSSELDDLLGRIPYLNGGLFDVHELEAANPDIQIPDAAFERIFDFFSEWHWHLDERPVRADNEVNPDVLGYIFEKYINQKQMGAYYTKEDITGYISRNTVIPFLFDAAAKGCAVAFQPDSAVWRLLRDDPDRYIYEPVRHGVDLPLPSGIEAGIGTVSERGGWNRAADAEFALPTETWREHVARRRRCHEVRAKLAGGEVHAINDLITLNLDICQFAQDVIENCEGPELLRAFWNAIGKVTVLDPTCGSGAFLFAALNVLYPLYEGCLTRMEGFVGDLERSGHEHHPETFGDFRKVLAHVEDHPNHRYFILKSIIVGNLFGVDIMEEAVEICKLRLFLKLAAQVERFEGLEPLPDIDFNIRAGNTLVGFASYKEVETSLATRMTFDDTLERIKGDAECAALAFQGFREMQTQDDMTAALVHGAKANVRAILDGLRQELDQHLARDYGVDVSKPEALADWQGSHHPFHWFVEFYAIIHDGGFDVIIGNPPYVEWRKVRDDYGVRGYATLSCGDLYALVLERTLTQLACVSGRLGMILPVSWPSTDGFGPLRDLMHATGRGVWASGFADRPSKLFEGVEKRLSILILGGATDLAPALETSKYHMWFAEERSVLLARLAYVSVPVPQLVSRDTMDGAIPKVSTATEVMVLTRLLAQGRPISASVVRGGGHPVYYTRKLRYFVQFFDFVPYVRTSDGASREPAEFKGIQFGTAADAAAALAALNSTLFFWFLTAYSDCRHVNKRETMCFPLDISRLSADARLELASLAHALMTDFRQNAVRRTIRFQSDTLTMEVFQPRSAKPILDEIDRVLAAHYGFTDEELDFIINYDTKYRMGGAESDEGEDEG